MSRGCTVVQVVWATPTGLHEAGTWPSTCACTSATSSCLLSDTLSSHFSRNRLFIYYRRAAPACAAPQLLLTRHGDCDRRTPLTPQHISISCPIRQLTITHSCQGSLEASAALYVLPSAVAVPCTTAGAVLARRVRLSWRKPVYTSSTCVA